MQYRTLGRTGIKVSPYALGTLIGAGKRPEFETGQEALAYDFTWQLTHHHAVDGATCTRAARESGQAGVVDVVVLTGLYLTACAIVNAFDVPVPAGTQPEWSAP
jgi:4-carboxymuconolactone decarboxylase